MLPDPIVADRDSFKSSTEFFQRGGVDLGAGFFSRIAN